MMKKAFYLFAIAIVGFSCGSSTSDQSAEGVVAKNTFNYSSSFEMSDKSIKRLIKDWNETLIQKDMVRAGEFLTDSVSIFLWDGSYFNAKRDSILQVLEKYVDKYSNVNVAHVAGMSVRSTDTGEYWGLSWTTERYTNDDGTAADLMIQESFLIQNGKISSIRQYAQKYTETPATVLPDERGDAEPEYTYSGSFELDDDKLKDVVIGWTEALESPTDFNKASKYLADSVSVFAANGDFVFSSKDSVIAYLDKRLSEYSKMEVELVASIAVKSTDRLQTWVLLWTEVTFTNLDGQEETFYIHEDYLLVNNKISRLRRYSRARPNSSV